MKFFIMMAAFLVTSCGTVTNSSVKQQVDYSNTPSFVGDDEEIIITFVGMRKGYLQDNSHLSYFNPDLEVYMNVSVEDIIMFHNSLNIKYGNTNQLIVPSDSEASKQIKSGEQIIIPANELNTKIANSKTELVKHLKIRFYENGLGIDDDKDELVGKELTVNSSVFGLKQISESEHRKKTYYLQVGESKAEIEFTIEIKKVIRAEK